MRVQSVWRVEHVIFQGQDNGIWTAVLVVPGFDNAKHSQNGGVTCG
jgi:hypothetical protein